MPLYDFQCGECKALFEVQATFAQKEAGLKPRCPNCESRKTRQLMSSTMVLLPVHGSPSAASDRCGGCGGGDCGHCRH